MPDVTTSPVSDPSGIGWTTETLRIHVESMIREQAERHARETTSHESRHLRDAEALTVRLMEARTALENALNSSQRAIDKAEDAQEKRNEALNEFRQQQNDLIGLFVRQDYMGQALEARDNQITSLGARIRDLELARSSSTGGAAKVTDQRAAMAAMVGVLGLVITMVVIFTNIITSR